MAAAVAGGTAARKKALADLQWEHTFTRELPGDAAAGGHPRQVHGAFFSRVDPTAMDGAPRLMACSREAADLLELDAGECATPEFARIFSGKAVLPGTQCYAQNYGGHQFGTWAGQLGDGRAITLGEVVNSRRARWEVQLKGAGLTPYSRRADGRAVVRSSVREFLCSEALFHLGIPTTRALSVVATGDRVWRDMFYDGRVKKEPGAVVCRLAPSFVRFGTFQLPALRGEGEAPLVQKLVDYVVKHHFPEIDRAAGGDKALALFREVADRTARLAAQWQSVGFVHGVLNTDNMSILGLTIDYGPFGFVERFDVDYTPNMTDLPGRRYSYKNQTYAVQWNLAQLGSALATAGVVQVEAAQEVLDAFSGTLTREYETAMARKFGLAAYDQDLSLGLMRLMTRTGADFTNTFRALREVLPQSQDQSQPPRAGPGIPPALEAVLAEAGLADEDEREAWVAWVDAYAEALTRDGMEAATRRKMQDAANPVYVLRNHLCQQAIAAAEKGDDAPLHALLEVMRNPYEEQAGKDAYKKVVPEEQAGPGVSVLSCSS